MLTMRGGGKKRSKRGGGERRREERRGLAFLRDGHVLELLEGLVEGEGAEIANVEDDVEHVAEEGECRPGEEEVRKRKGEHEDEDEDGPGGNDAEALRLEARAALPDEIAPAEAEALRTVNARQNEGELLNDFGLAEGKVRDWSEAQWAEGGTKDLERDRVINKSRKEAEERRRGGDERMREGKEDEEGRSSMSWRDCVPFLLPSEADRFLGEAELRDGLEDGRVRDLLGVGVDGACLAGYI